MYRFDETDSTISLKSVQERIEHNRRNEIGIRITARIDTTRSIQMHTEYRENDIDKRSKRKSRRNPQNRIKEQVVTNYANALHRPKCTILKSPSTEKGH